MLWQKQLEGHFGNTGFAAFVALLVSRPNDVSVCLAVLDVAVADSADGLVGGVVSGGADVVALAMLE